MNDETEQIGDIIDNQKNRLSNLNFEGKVDGRKNNGRRKGSMNKATRESKLAKKRFQERVNLNADKLFNAQLDLAVGEKHLMVMRTEGSGKNRRRWTEIVDNPELIKEYLDGDLEDTEDSYYYMTTKPANNQAIDSLLNRSFGKATEKVEMTGGFFKATKMIVEVVGADYEDEGDRESSTSEAE